MTANVKLALTVVALGAAFTAAAVIKKGFDDRIASIQEVESLVAEAKRLEDALRFVGIEISRQTGETLPDYLAKLRETSGLKWNEGGTLHGKTIAEWRAASGRDRLATSADFVAKVRKFSSLDDMLVAAHGMQTCITEASPDEAIQRQRVAGIAAACAALLGY